MDETMTRDPNDISYTGLKTVGPLVKKLSELLPRATAPEVISIVKAAMDPATGQIDERKAIELAEKLKPELG
jgi:hypothetical protein